MEMNMKSICYIRISVCIPLLIILWASFLLPGCHDTNSRDDASSKMTLKILHINDAHSNLDTSDIDLAFNGVEVSCEIGGMARVASKISELAQAEENHLVLHAGDAVQGTLYYTLFQGQADADVMNAIGFDAMAIGNHEFDDGDDWLAGFISIIDAPLISANIEAAAGNVLEGTFSPYIITEAGGERIGIIGLTIAGKTRNSSQPSEEITLNDEVTSTQAAVDELTAQGIGKIILLSHYGYANSLALAAQVSDIDIIVDGDSHTLLGNFSEYGLDSSGDYPTIVQNLDGDTVCVVQAWEYGKVVGELNVTFLGDKVDSFSGTPHLILGDTFTGQDDLGEAYTIDGAELVSVQAAVDADDQLDIVSDDETVAAIIATYSNEVDALGKTVIGRADEALLHNRVPGHEYSGVTLPLGSDIAPIVAKAFYEQDGNADICIQNAGGVRISINPGDITYDTAYTLLPFTNTLFEIEMTGAEIKQVLEDAIENIAQGGSTGSFPYCYALKYDVDARRPFGSRLSNLEVKDRATGIYSDLQDNGMYVVVTNNYTAGGRDGYITFETVQDERGQGTDTYLDYALSFVNYVEDLTAQGISLAQLPASDHCIKSYISTSDTTDSL